MKFCKITVLLLLLALIAPLTSHAANFNNRQQNEEYLEDLLTEYCPSFVWSAQQTGQPYYYENQQYLLFEVSKLLLIGDTCLDKPMYYPVWLKPKQVIFSFDTEEFYWLNDTQNIFEKLF